MAKKEQKPEARALAGHIVALHNHGSITIMESQQEFEGEQGAVVPAKSIWLNTSSGMELLKFLLEIYRDEKEGMPETMRDRLAKAVKETFERETKGVDLNTW
jgi:hypothetical protein